MEEYRRHSETVETQRRRKGHSGEQEHKRRVGAQLTVGGEGTATATADGRRRHNGTEEMESRKKEIKMGGCSA